MLDLVFKNTTDDKFFGEDFFKKVLEVAIEQLKLSDKKLGISINLTNEDKIKELNLKYRNKDRVTDVLSFPVYSKLEIENWKLKIDFDLGDIFICLPFAKIQAKSEDIRIEKKLAQFTVHGFLHLLGYDHEKGEKNAKEMFDLEDKILDKIKQIKLSWQNHT